MAPFAQRRELAHLKHPGGRPSEYRPEYCQLVIEKMREGVSLTGFAALIGVSKEAIYNWMTLHREFSDAVARARPARVLWWEQKLMRSRKGAETTASIFALRNADPTEWRDIRNVQHDHNVRVEALTDQQLFAIASGCPAGDGQVIEGEIVPDTVSD
jgi:hypothetical protein